MSGVSIKIILYLIVQAVTLLVLAWFVYLVGSIILLPFGVETWVTYFFRVIGPAGQVMLFVASSLVCLVLWLVIEAYWRKR